MIINGLETGKTAEPRPGCQLTQLVAGSEMNQIHVRMEPGAEHEMHSHPNEQIGFVLNGELTILIRSGEKRTVAQGDAYQIDAGVEHEPRNEGEEPVESIEIFSPVREMDYWD